MLGFLTLGGDSSSKFVAARIAPVINACYFVTYPFVNIATVTSSLDVS